MSRTAEIVTFPELPEHRLRRAIARLDAALEEQAQAVGGFRAGISGLGDAVEDLGRSTQEYRVALDGLARQLGRTRDAAHALEARATALARPG